MGTIVDTSKNLLPVMQRAYTLSCRHKFLHSISACILGKMSMQETQIGTARLYLGTAGYAKKDDHQFYIDQIGTKKSTLHPLEQNALDAKKVKVPYINTNDYTYTREELDMIVDYDEFIQDMELALQNLKVKFAKLAERMDEIGAGRKTVHKEIL